MPTKARATSCKYPIATALAGDNRVDGGAHPDIHARTEFRAIQARAGDLGVLGGVLEGDDGPLGSHGPGEPRGAVAAQGATHCNPAPV